MTQPQVNEAMKMVQCLNDAREHLDNACFRMGPVNPNDEQYEKCRTAYGLICEALDLF